jgi:hypothetical protein
MVSVWETSQWLLIKQPARVVKNIKDFSQMVMIFLYDVFAFFYEIIYLLIFFVHALLVISGLIFLWFIFVEPFWLLLKSLL